MSKTKDTNKGRHYLVTLYSSKGIYPSDDALHTAVANSAPQWDALNWVKVEEVKAKNTAVTFQMPLFAVGRAKGKGWELFGFYDSLRKANNGVNKCIRNYRNVGLKGTKFAVLEYNPTTSEWGVVGSEKVS